MPKKTVSVVGVLAVSVGTLGFLQLDNPYVLSAPGSTVSTKDTRDVPFVLQATHTISIKNLQFNPTTMDMATGDTVTWTNNEEDGTVHKIVSDDGSSFVSPDVPPAQAYSYAPSSPGTYAYHCSIHPQTTGTLNVSGDPSTPPPPDEPPPPSDPQPPPEEPPPSDSGSVLDLILDLLPIAALPILAAPLGI